MDRQMQENPQNFFKKQNKNLTERGDTTAAALIARSSLEPRENKEASENPGHEMSVLIRFFLFQNGPRICPPCRSNSAKCGPVRAGSSHRGPEFEFRFWRNLDFGPCSFTGDR